MDNDTVKGLDALNAVLSQFGQRAMEVSADLLHARGETIMGDSKATYVPVDQSTLQGSGYVEKPVIAGENVSVRLAYGGPAAPYAQCVFGGGTRVSTPEGRREISTIREGDSVLTQTGEYRRVIATTRTPAVLKPDLVDIVATWRGIKDAHKITVTSDHRMLTYRDGRRIWVRAGELTTTDMLFHRRKQTHNKGNRAYRYVCSFCGSQFASSSGRKRLQAARYCSIECRNSAYAGQAHPSRGRHRSAESMLPACRARALKRWSGEGTEVERSVERWLIRRGVKYEREHQIGARHVDFFLPEHLVAIEADGAYWHADQAADIARDRELLDAGLSGLRVIHLHFFDAKFSPEHIESEPLPGVFYVTCNPGPDSFVDPEVFVSTPVVNVYPWRYVGFSAPLYDLTIEGIHSFMASGVIISNSVHEHLSEHSPRSWKAAEASGKGVHFTQGGPKYLELPFIKGTADLAQWIADGIKSRLGT